MVLPLGVFLLGEKDSFFLPKGFSVKKLPS